MNALSPINFYSKYLKQASQIQSFMGKRPPAAVNVYFGSNKDRFEGGVTYIVPTIEIPEQIRYTPQFSMRFQQILMLCALRALALNKDHPEIFIRMRDANVKKNLALQPEQLKNFQQDSQLANQAVISIADSIRNCPVPVTIIAENDIGPRALRIFMSADRRLISRNTQVKLNFVIDPPEGRRSELVRKKERINDIKHDLMYLTNLKFHLAPPYDFDSLASTFMAGQVYNAAYCLKRELVDGVVVGEGPVHSSGNVQNIEIMDRKALNELGNKYGQDWSFPNQIADDVVRQARELGRLKTIRFTLPDAGQTSEGGAIPDLIYACFPKLASSHRKQEVYGVIDAEQPKLSKGYARIQIVNAPPGHKSFYFRDTILHANAFDSESVQELKACLEILLEKRCSKNALLIMNSYGGFVKDGELFHEIFQRHSTQRLIDILVQGQCSSTAAFTLCKATGKRFATPGASIMIHEISGTDEDRVEELTKSVTKLISEASGRDENEVQQDLLCDFRLNALEALLYGPKGLIDAIVTRKDGQEIFITQAMVLNYFKTDYGLTDDEIRMYIDGVFLHRRTGQYRKTLMPQYYNRLWHCTMDDLLGKPLLLIDKIAQRELTARRWAIYNLQENNKKIESPFESSIGDTGEQRDLDILLTKKPAVIPL